MKEPIDQFSRQAKLYQQYRPKYPAELYEFVLANCPSRNRAWDCGTGNGQVATVLAESFNRVYATDISEQQLAHAPNEDHIIYQKMRAESTTFPINYFDLITVAQAIHWFDISAFFREVKRVLKPGGIIAV